jgi:hypothetical protein
MTWFINLNKALYFRSKAFVMMLEGESEITHISSILLMTLFHLCIIFLFILILKYINLPLVQFSGDLLGEIYVFIFSLGLATGYFQSGNMVEGESGSPAC